MAKIITVQFSSPSQEAEYNFALDRAKHWLDLYFSAKSAESEQTRLEEYLFWADRCSKFQPLTIETDYIDYTPKKSLFDYWDNEPTFGQQAPKQETDLEDIYLSSKSVSFRGKPDQSKSKSKWARSGKAARVLSNR